MRYLCKKPCQVKVGKKIHTLDYGEVYTFPDEIKVESPYIVCLDKATDYKIDFTKASESELRETKWKFSEAAKQIWERYEVELKESLDKEVIITQILDIRYRSIHPPKPAKGAEVD